MRKNGAMFICNRCRKQVFAERFDDGKYDSKPLDGWALDCERICGIGDRLRSLERQQALLKSDEALIRGQIDRLDSVHNLILTEYYIGHKKWAEVQVDAGYSIQHLKRLRNVALLAFGRGMERLPECPALLSRAYNVRETLPWADAWVEGDILL